MTLDLASGSTETYGGSLPNADRLVKKGGGCAILSAASPNFRGRIEIEEGTLVLSEREAVGSGTKIEVTGDAATLHLNFPRPAGATADTMFFAGHDVTIRGRGVDGKGAFRYTATSDGADDSMLESLTLSGDAYIAVPSRFGIRKALTLNGHTLTRIDGSETWAWRFDPTEGRMGAGAISNVTGIVLMRSVPAFDAPENMALYMAGGELRFSDAVRPLPCPVVFCGGVLKAEAGSDAARNVISGVCRIEDNLHVSSFGTQIRHELVGSVTATGSGDIRQWGGGVLYLNGPMSAKSKNLQVSGGRVVCSSNVVRQIGGLILNGNASRVELSAGSLDANMVRVGSGLKRNALVQSGGTFTLDGANVWNTLLVGEGEGPYGAWLMSGGMATFSNSVVVAQGAGSEGLVWQTGGLFQLRKAGALSVGQSGRGFLGVFGGATNDTRLALRAQAERLRLGAGSAGCATLVVSGRGSVVTTESLALGAEAAATTNVVAVTDGGTLKACRFYRTASVAPESVSDVYVDDGTVMPTWAWGWTGRASSDSSWRPDFWSIGPGGMVIDTSELEEGERASSQWVHLLADASGRGLATVTLPTDAAFAKEVYNGPVSVFVEGPKGSHGAAAVAAFDAESGKLTHIVVVSPGCDYDETTRVFLPAASGTDRYICAYELTGARLGGRLTKRGAGGVALYAANTYTGGTVVEAGTLVMAGEASFPANTALKVMDGATFENGGRALVVSVLGGAGGCVTKCSRMTVSEALEITAAELFAASGPLTVEAQVSLAEGVVVRVVDSGNLSAHQSGKGRPFLRATGGFVGTVPKEEMADASGGRWRLSLVGDTLYLKPVKGFAVFVR